MSIGAIDNFIFTIDSRDNVFSQGAIVKSQMKYKNDEHNPRNPFSRSNKRDEI